MISVQPVKLFKTWPTSDNMCIHSQSSSSKLRQTTSFLSACFPSLLPLAFYFYSFPHSSTLFLSALVLFFILLSTIPFRSRNWTIWLEADIKNLFPLHSVLSFHVNERKTSLRSVLFKISCHLLCRFISSSNSSPPKEKASFHFLPIFSFSFRILNMKRIQLW